MTSGEPVPGSVYFYAPVQWAPPIFAVLFFVITVAHVWQCVKYKAWRITGLHPMCGLLFTIGFALRAYGSFEYGNVNIYIASTICIYCTP
jgi:predicted ferric reductase